MIKVLHVYPQLNSGGTEMVIYNLIKFGRKDAFCYEILTQDHGCNEQIFLDLGCRIHVIPRSSKSEYSANLKKFFAEGKYDVVHAHMHCDIPIVLKSAKAAGIKHRIAHSHNARLDIPQYLWPLVVFKHHCYEKYATDFFGCSKLALKWLFPMKWKRGVVVYNGIDLNKFKFDKDVRNKTRTENRISDDTLVFVNVGRCEAQKNQNFILDLAKNIHRDSLFIIIGEGSLHEQLKQRKERESLNNVWLLGNRSDVTEWLCAADVFLFPSIYEGLGIVAIEAQSSGLPVLATDNIPVEADMGIGSLRRLPLNDTKRWIDAIRQTSVSYDKRSCLSEKALASKYDIKEVTKEVEAIYLL